MASEILPPASATVHPAFRFSSLSWTAAASGVFFEPASFPK